MAADDGDASKRASNDAKIRARGFENMRTTLSLDDALLERAGPSGRALGRTSQAPILDIGGRRDCPPEIVSRLPDMKAQHRRDGTQNETAQAPENKGRHVGAKASGRIFNRHLAHIGREGEGLLERGNS